MKLVHPDAGNAAEGKQGSVLDAVQLAEREEEEEKEGGVAECHQEEVLGVVLVGAVHAPGI